MMKCQYRLCFAGCAAFGLVLAVFVVPVSAKSPDAKSPLDRCLPEIVRNPFPSEEVQLRLGAGMAHAIEESKQRRERRLRDFEETEKQDPNSDHHFMGWTVSDKAYW